MRPGKPLFFFRRGVASAFGPVAHDDGCACPRELRLLPLAEKSIAGDVLHIHPMNNGL